MNDKEKLKDIFSNVNDWLKFGEAKHAGLTILNSGFIVGILTAFSNLNNYFYKMPTLLAIVVFGISLFICLLSQLPITTILAFNTTPIPNPNMFFYGHLAKMDNDKFIAEFTKSFPGANFTDIDKDLINQILINARIANGKYVMYKIASYFTVFATGILGLSSLIKILWAC